MTFIGSNAFALIAAAAASFIFGGVWYGVLGKQWMAALGRTPEEMKAAQTSSMPVLLAITILCQLVMAFVLAGILLHLARGGTPVGIRSGMITGAFCWLGFVATTLVVNHGYQGARRTLTLIDGAHWLGVLLIQGAVLAIVGLR